MKSIIYLCNRIKNNLSYSLFIKHKISNNIIEKRNKMEKDIKQKNEPSKNPIVELVKKYSKDKLKQNNRK